MVNRKICGKPNVVPTLRPAPRGVRSLTVQGSSVPVAPKLITPRVRTETRNSFLRSSIGRSASCSMRHKRSSLSGLGKGSCPLRLIVVPHSSHDILSCEFSHPTVLRILLVQSGHSISTISFSIIAPVQTHANTRNRLALQIGVRYLQCTSFDSHTFYHSFLS
jgi:hypothetical protein